MGQTEIELEIIVPTHTRYLGLIGNIAEQLAHGLPDYAGDRDALAYHLNLVLTEALANAIEHSGKTPAQESVRVCIRLKNKNLFIEVHDQGCGFDLEGIPCPDPAELCEHGRGIFLIRTFMDTVDYHKTDSGNVLEMRKKLI
jgi:serine/threonine-protein kinase RsbW